MQCVLYLAAMQADQTPDNCDMTDRLQQALWAETLALAFLHLFSVPFEVTEDAWQIHRSAMFQTQVVGLWFLTCQPFTHTPLCAGSDFQDPLDVAIRLQNSGTP